MAFLDYLHKPFTLSGADNIDPRYFTDNGDGTYTATPLFIHNVARDAVEYFKSVIKRLDSDGTYYSEINKVRQDPWAKAQHKSEWEKKYEKQIEQSAKLYKEYCDKHPEMFEERVRTCVGGKDEAKFFAGYLPDVTVSLAEAVAAYNAAKEVADKYKKDGAEYETLPKETYNARKPEFNEHLDMMKKKFDAQCGVPEDDWVCPNLPTTPQINWRACKKVAADDSNLEPFTMGLIEHITSSTAAKYKQEISDAKELIDEKFVDKFNDIAKSTKAVGDMKGIVVWTKPTDNNSAEKFISIEKTDPSDVYYTFRVEIKNDEVEFAHARTVVTKTDLRKIITQMISIFNMDDSLKPFIDDMERFADVIL